MLPMWECCQWPMGRARASATLLFPPPRWRLSQLGGRAAARPSRRERCRWGIRSRGSATLPWRWSQGGRRWNATPTSARARPPAREVPVGKWGAQRLQSPRGGNAQDARCPSEAAGVPLPRGEGRAAARPPARVVPVGDAVARERDPPGASMDHTAGSLAKLASRSASVGM